MDSSGFSTMQISPEVFEAQLRLVAPLSSSVHQLFLKTTTYLAKLAIILRHSPENMLSCSQLVDTMMSLMEVDKKSLARALGVCLSSNKCFVKIPLTLDPVSGSRNYWRLDTSQISAKIVWRHFSGILELFPELASKTETPITSRGTGWRVCLPEDEAYIPVQFLPTVRPWEDSPSARTSRSSPLTAVQVNLQQQPPSIRGCFGLLPPAGGSSPIWPVGGSTHHGLFDGSAAASIRRMDDITGASFPNYTGTSAAPYLTSPPDSYITYSLHGVTQHALCYFQ